MTLANIVTSLRIALIPVYAGATFLWLDSSGSDPTWRWTAFGLFFLLSTTDLLDGALARWRDEQTVTGAWLDPTADKLLMLASLLLLAPSKIPLWFLFLWFVREVVMLSGVILMHTRIPDIRMTPRPISKAATFLQFLVVGAAFLTIPAGPVMALTLLAAAATAGSGLLYMRDGFRQVYGHDWGRLF